MVDGCPWFQKMLINEQLREISNLSVDDRRAQIIGNVCYDI